MSQDYTPNIIWPEAPGPNCEPHVLEAYIVNFQKAVGMAIKSGGYMYTPSGPIFLRETISPDNSTLSPLTI